MPERKCLLRSPGPTNMHGTNRMSDKWSAVPRGRLTERARAMRLDHLHARLFDVDTAAIFEACKL